MKKMGRVIVVAIGWPSFMAGVQFGMASAAAMAALSKAGWSGWMTWALVTAPVSEIVNSTKTLPSTPSALAASG